MDRDKRRREVLHLPCPEYIPTKEDEEDEKKEEKAREERSSSKKDDRSSRERHEYRDRRSPRRSPPRYLLQCCSASWPTCSRFVAVVDEQLTFERCPTHSCDSSRVTFMMPYKSLCCCYQNFESLEVSFFIGRNRACMNYDKFVFIVIITELICAVIVSYWRLPISYYYYYYY